MSETTDDIIHRTRVVAVSVVLLLLVGLVGSLVVWRLRLSHDVNNQLRALRAECRAGHDASVRAREIYD